MRFLFVKFPENNDFDPENEGYHAIDEPSFLKLCLMSIPVILISMFIIGLMLKIRLGADYHLSMIDSFQDFVILLALVPIHEMLHVIVFPDKISSRDIFIGTYRGAIYATYLWDIKKERFLLGFNIADHCFNGYTRSFFNDLKYKLPTFIKNCDYEYGFIESGCPVILWDFDQNSGECKNSK